MRLGQLARKLALRPDQIVEFLAKKNIQIDDGSNTRLEDSHIALLVEKFAPHGFEITPQELPLQEVAAEILAPEEIGAPEAEKIEMNKVSVSEAILETTISEEKVEVIKAPKVELSGLKVLGKIDLPEPKKKEMPTAELTPAAESEKEIKPRERTRPLQSRNARVNSTSRPAKNPIALQREEMEAQRKLEAAKALEKERRAQHYYSKVKVVTPVKTAKHEQVQEETTIEPATKPKTLLGKFFRWFTT